MDVWEGGVRKLSLFVCLFICRCATVISVVMPKYIAETVELCCWKVTVVIHWKEAAYDVMTESQKKVIFTVIHATSQEIVISAFPSLVKLS